MVTARISQPAGGPVVSQSPSGPSVLCVSVKSFPLPEGLSGKGLLGFWVSLSCTLWRSKKTLTQKPEARPTLFGKNKQTNKKYYPDFEVSRDIAWALVRGFLTELDIHQDTKEKEGMKLASGFLTIPWNLLAQPLSCWSMVYKVL